MIHEEKQVAEDTKAHHRCENFWASRIAFTTFFGI